MAVLNGISIEGQPWSRLGCALLFPAGIASNFSLPQFLPLTELAGDMSCPALCFSQKSSIALTFFAVKCQTGTQWSNLPFTCVGGDVAFVWIVIAVWADQMPCTTTQSLFFGCALSLLHAYLFPSESLSAGACNCKVQPGLCWKRPWDGNDLPRAYQVVAAVSLELEGGKCHGAMCVNEKYTFSRSWILQLAQPRAQPNGSCVPVPLHPCCQQWWAHLAGMCLQVCHLFHGNPCQGGVRVMLDHFSPLPATLCMAGAGTGLGAVTSFLLWPSGSRFLCTTCICFDSWNCSNALVT